MVDDAERARYQAAWNEKRSRRYAVLGWFIYLIPAVLFLALFTGQTTWPTLACFALCIGLRVREGLFRCPRRGHLFNANGEFTYSAPYKHLWKLAQGMHCGNCGLEQGTIPD